MTMVIRVQGLAKSFGRTRAWTAALTVVFAPLAIRRYRRLS